VHIHDVLQATWAEGLVIRGHSGVGECKGREEHSMGLHIN
jgi:hypothetical protein